MITNNGPEKEPRFYIDKKDDAYRHYSLDHLRLTCQHCSNVFEDFAGEGFDVLAYRVEAVWLCESCYIQQYNRF